MSKNKGATYWELIEDQNLTSRKLLLLLEEEIQDIFSDIANRLFDISNLLEDIKGVPQIDNAKKEIDALLRDLEEK